MKKLDLTGRVFGRWHVGAYVRRPENTNAYWVCTCDCGNVREVAGYSLTMKKSLSCGCLQVERTSNANKKHGMSHTPLFAVWNTMKQRCSNPNSEKYPRYGGRGITVCEEWRSSFLVFYNWATESGYRPDLSIDRIDNNGNYEPGNCHWASDSLQANNKSNNLMVAFRGKLFTLSELSKTSGINYGALKARIRRDWTAERAISLLPRIGRNQFG